MGLTKYKLGKLIEQCDNRNTDEEYTADDVRGISTGKEFIETKANMDGVSLTSYKIVKENGFVKILSGKSWRIHLQPKNTWQKNWFWLQ